MTQDITVSSWHFCSGTDCDASLGFFLFFKEIMDDGNSLAMMYQAISELPLPNRDTLACLMVHLQK